MENRWTPSEDDNRCRHERYDCETCLRERSTALIAACDRHIEGMVEPLSERCRELVDAVKRAKGE